MSKWISVKDKLPEMETPVLAIVKGQIRMAEIRTEYPNLEDTYSAFEYWDCPLNDGQDWQNEDVTYWMPLPNPPQEVV